MKKTVFYTESIRNVKVQTIEPKYIFQEKLIKLIESLYTVHCKIFDGVDKNNFIHYVIFPEANYTKIHLFKNTKGELVGYFSFHHFEKQIGPKKVIILRGEAGILPEYRRKHNVITEIIKDGLISKLRYFFREVYVLGCFVHPIMYYSIAKNAYRVYPNYRYETPQKIKMLMFELAKEFHLKKIDENTPFVREIGWITKESDVDRQRLRNSEKKEIQFYLEQNPNYGKGFGLEILIPLSFSNLLFIAYNFTISHFGLDLRVHAKN
jgi:hypothetical protein